ncbi:MAG: AAA family ATPase [Rhodospirillaceae bacterium]|nr:AAA family ATPase [Rhodospirillaceae bacterium]
MSVMFADLVGYTALAQRIDPEEMHGLLARFFEIADEIILQFGGRVDKHIGDNVMALFGAPIAHGDDPERAVGAAHALHQVMPELSAEAGRNLSVHIGIAVGDVLASGLGSAVHSTYTVVGPAVNLAARLMERAGPGETLVSEEVARHVGQSFEIVQLGEQAIKGLAAPAPIFRAGAPLSDSHRHRRPIIGRRSECAQIDALLATCRDEGVGASLVVRGVPGIGKSRLAEEAVQRARGSGFHCFVLRILDFGTGAIRDPHRQLALALASVVGESDYLDPLQRAMLASLVDRPLLPEEARHLEAMSHAARQGVRANALAQMLADAAARQPTLMVIEDIHWADDSFLLTLASLADRVAGSRAMLLMTTRVDPDPIDATWRASLRSGRVISIDLTPLSSTEALEMSTQIAIDIDPFVHRCVARAEGNPLFLEQLLRHRQSGEGGVLPDSLQNVVLARLDQLPEGERTALQAASILGQQFSGEDLARLLGHPGFDGAAMVRRQLLRPTPGGYLFAHALIHSGIYSALTREHRRQLHRKAAELFAERDPVLFAEHLDRAESDAAVDAYRRAARHEASLYHLDRAAQLAARGLTLARTPLERCRLGLEAGRRFLDIGDPLAARAAFERALEAEPEPLDRSRTLVGLAACHRQLGDIDLAMNHLLAAEPLADAEDEPALLAEISYLRGNLNFALGRADECLAAHGAALAAARQAGEAEWLARAESGLGDAYYLQGRYALAQRHFINAVDAAESAGLLRIVPANRGMIGNCHVFYGRFDLGLEDVAAACAAATQIGDRFGEMFGLECRAFILMTARRWPEAETPAREAMELAAEIGARRYESITATILAMSLLAAGRNAEAEALSRRAVVLAEETGIGFAGALILAVRAIILGIGAEARAAIERGEVLLRQTGMAHNHIFFRAFAIDWAIIADDWALLDRFAGGLAQFTAAEPLPYVEIVIERARLLARLQRNPGDVSARRDLMLLAADARRIDFRLAFPEA